MVRTVILAALAAVFCSGCASMGGAANPSTEIKVGHDGVRFYDSKDNYIEVVNLDVDPTTKHFKCEKLTIRNNASDVRIANVQQMDAFDRQLETHGRNIERIFSGMETLASVVAPLAFPGVKLNGPLGGSATINSAATSSLIEMLREPVNELVRDALKKNGIGADGQNNRGNE